MTIRRPGATGAALCGRLGPGSSPGRQTSANGACPPFSYHPGRSAAESRGPAPASRRLPGKTIEGRPAPLPCHPFLPRGDDLGSTGKRLRRFGADWTPGQARGDSRASARPFLSTRHGARRRYGVQGQPARRFAADWTPGQARGDMSRANGARLSTVAPGCDPGPRAQRHEPPSREAGPPRPSPPHEAQPDGGHARRGGPSSRSGSPASPPGARASLPGRGRSRRRRGGGAGGPTSSGSSPGGRWRGGARRRGP